MTAARLAAARLAVPRTPDARTAAAAPANVLMTKHRVRGAARSGPMCAVPAPTWPSTPTRHQRRTAPAGPCRTQPTRPAVDVVASAHASGPAVTRVHATSMRPPDRPMRRRTVPVQPGEPHVRTTRSALRTPTPRATAANVAAAAAADVGVGAVDRRVRPTDRPAARPTLRATRRRADRRADRRAEPPALRPRTARPTGRASPAGPAGHVVQVDHVDRVDHVDPADPAGPAARAVHANLRSGTHRHVATDSRNSHAE